MSIPHSVTRHRVVVTVGDWIVASRAGVEAAAGRVDEILQVFVPALGYSVACNRF